MARARKPKIISLSLSKQNDLHTYFGFVFTLFCFLFFGAINLVSFGNILAARRLRLVESSVSLRLGSERRTSGLTQDITARG